MTLTATGYKVQGKHTVDLTWTGSTAVDILRDGASIASAAGSTYTDSIGATGNATYTYVVCDLGSPACSNTEVVVFGQG